MIKNGYSIQYIEVLYGKVQYCFITVLSFSARNIPDFRTKTANTVQYSRYIVMYCIVHGLYSTILYSTVGYCRIISKLNDYSTVLHYCTVYTVL